MVIECLPEMELMVFINLSQFSLFAVVYSGESQSVIYKKRLQVQHGQTGFVHATLSS
jgi:hypothetical protein